MSFQVNPGQEHRDVAFGVRRHDAAWGSVRCSKIVIYIEVIHPKTLDGLEETRLCILKKPMLGTPGIVFCVRDNTMFRRVVVDIFQPGEIGFRVRNLRFPELEPDFSTRMSVLLVEDSGTF
jgi:hypothetical protein